MEQVDLNIEVGIETEQVELMLYRKEFYNFIDEYLRLNKKIIYMVIYNSVILIAVFTMSVFSCIRSRNEVNG